MLLAIDMIDLAVDDASGDPWAAYPEEVMQSGWNPDVPRLQPGPEAGHDARPYPPADEHPRSETHPKAA